MNKRHCSAWVVARYVLLQLPTLGLLVLTLILVRRWVDLPAWFMCSLVALWVLKDLILYPFIRRAHNVDRLAGIDSVIGTRGTAIERLAPSGYVLVHGELWKAKVMGGEPAIGVGEIVRVRGIEGLRLLVERERYV